MAAVLAGRLAEAGDLGVVSRYVGVLAHVAANEEIKEKQNEKKILLSRLFITIFPRPHGAGAANFSAAHFSVINLLVWISREWEGEGDGEFMACGLHATDGKFAFRFWLSPVRLRLRLRKQLAASAHV